MKLKKKKRIGGCDTPVPKDKEFPQEKTFPDLPIRLEFDFSQNSAFHFRHQGSFICDDYPCEYDDIYKIKYCLKL
jgi:hypothetical protein